MKKYNIGIVGIDHIVSKKIVSLLEERNFPVNYIKPTVTGEILERYLSYDSADYVIDRALPSLFRGMDFIFFVNEEGALENLFPHIKQIGVTVIDNCTSSRRNRDIPLVVPEINSGCVTPDRKIYTTPSPNSIFLAMVLKPIYNRVGLKKVVVTVAQSDCGIQTINYVPKKTLENEQLNIISYTGNVEENNYTDEEIAIGEEIKRILQDSNLTISSTVFKVPTYRVNCLSVNIETRKKITADEVRTGLFNTKGIRVVDDRENLKYPASFMCEEKDEIYVGRIRENPEIENCIDLFICGDVLRKGSALNMVQIAEEVVKTEERLHKRYII